jgi:eukaryotic-like serine/threonine-protein kinase
LAKDDLVAVIETTVAGRYRIVGRIAAGGMGEVYRAHDAVLGREVAVKMLHPQYANDRGFVDRFRREARAAAVLNHPNIVGVYDWGITESTYFMVMEFIRGHNLRTLLSRNGHLEPAQVADVARQVLAALDHAHGHGIVHRDIKPENILVTGDGDVKVADFGLARAFAESTVSQVEGTVTGTVQYLAPEQIQGEPSDPRTDLYATGVVMFELLTGEAPFAGETSMAIAYKHLSERVPPPSSRVPTIPPAMDEVVLHATEREPPDRPASARSMNDELAGAARRFEPAPRLADLARQVPAAELEPHERASTVTIPRAYSRKARRRKRLIRTFVVLVTILALAAGAWAAWTYAVPHYTAVPKGMVGLAPAQAIAKLDAAGLHGVNGVSVHSSAVENGLLLRMNPPEGQRVKRGSAVTLVYSSGPATTRVPSVKGMTVADARAALTGAHLQTVQRGRYDETAPVGEVVDQDPVSGIRLQEGETVTIFVSRGPRPITLDTYAGQPAATVEAALRNLGLVPRRTEVYATTVGAGDVVRTDPIAGTVVHRGDGVTVVVSLGPRTFPMPDVVGQTKDQAVAFLTSLGLDPQTRQLPGSAGDLVVGQIPIKEAIVQQGQQVTLYIGG